MRQGCLPNTAAVMACICRFTPVSSSTTGLRAASASSALFCKADFSVSQSARSLLKLSFNFSMAAKALVSSSFALEVSACWDLMFSCRSAVWESFLLSSAYETQTYYEIDGTYLKYQVHNNLCTWYLGANACLLVLGNFYKSQAQYKYYSWHLGATSVKDTVLQF